MAAYAALLRAINVGGTGKLAKDELIALCREAGCDNVRTYIQSGNVLFTTSLTRNHATAAIATAASARLGKPIEVVLRSENELVQIVTGNPFPKADPSRVIILFFNKPPKPCPIEAPGREEVVFRGREIYIHYPDGQGRSKLKLPSTMAALCTGRNLSTTQKIANLLANP